MKLFIFFFLIPITLVQTPRIENYDKIQIAIREQQKGDYSKSLELLIAAKEEAEQNQWYKELFLALNNIGANYYLLTDYGEALENYLVAYEVASNHLDSQNEMVVLNNVGILFYDEDKLTDAEAYFLKAFEIANQLNTTEKKAAYAINLALLYNKMGALAKSKYYLEMAMPLLKKSPTKRLQAQFAQGEYLYLKGEYKQAKKYLRELIPQLRTVSLYDQAAYSYLFLSKIYQEEQNEEKAKYYIALASSNHNSLEAQMDVYQQASSLAQNRNNYKTALRYRDSIFLVKDSMYTVKSNNLFEANRVKFSIKKYENEMIQKEKEGLLAERIYTVILISTSILLLVLLWAWRSSVIKMKQKKIIADRNQKIKMLELKQELDAKNRKLTVKALSISSRNTLLQEVGDFIKKDPMLATKPDFKQLLSKLNQLIKKETNSHDFLVHFEETNHSFLTSLRKKHPNLNSNDIRFLSYLYMDLSIKEIAVLLHITPDACRKRKERIAKKMNLDKTAKLYPYLTSLM